MKTMKKIGIYLISIVFLISTGYPFIFVLITSFKDKLEYLINIWKLPSKIYLGNYAKVLAPSFLRYFVNSFVVASISVCLVLITASMASFAFAKMKFKLNNTLFILFVAGMMIPVHTTLIPIYVLINKIGLFDSLPGLIGPYTSFALPIAIFILTQFFREVPKELEEAATIDGCTPFMIYRRIMLPLATPAIATVAIYNFLQMWNEFIYALVLINTPARKTLPLGIREFYGLETVNIPGIVTAICIGTLPVLTIYFFAQEKVINGLVSGAVKG